MRSPEARGFTLIELLIVIAIIGILSATVLVSLNTARTKARTVVVKTSVIEMRKIMELEYLESGSYAALNKGWAGGGTQPTCAAVGYTGTYAAQAVEICKKVHEFSGGQGYSLLIYPDTALGFSTANHYSITAVLPDGNMFCVGSSGRVTSSAAWTNANYSLPGCYSNP